MNDDLDVYFRTYFLWVKYITIDIPSSRDSLHYRIIRCIYICPRNQNNTCWTIVVAMWYNGHSFFISNSDQTSFNILCFCWWFDFLMANSTLIHKSCFLLLTLEMLLCLVLVIVKQIINFCSGILEGKIW